VQVRRGERCSGDITWRSVSESLLRCCAAASLCSTRFSLSSAATLACSAASRASAAAWARADCSCARATDDSSDTTRPVRRPLRRSSSSSSILYRARPSSATSSDRSSAKSVDMFTAAPPDSPSAESRSPAASDGVSPGVPAGVMAIRTGEPASGTLTLARAGDRHSAGSEKANAGGDPTPTTRAGPAPSWRPAPGVVLTSAGSENAKSGGTGELRAGVCSRGAPVSRLNPVLVDGATEPLGRRPKSCGGIGEGEGSNMRWSPAASTVAVRCRFPGSAGSLAR
jgi:hypothetical protein